MNSRSIARVLAVACAFAASLAVTSPASAISLPELAVDFGFGAGAPSPGVDNAWPDCSTPTQQYCVESATIGSLDANRRVWILADSDAPGGSASIPSSFNFQLEPGRAWGPGAARIAIRVGKFQPRYTFAVSDGIDVSATTDDDLNTTIVISGRTTGYNWNYTEGFSCRIDSCGDSSTRASISGLGFSGNVQDMGGPGWDPDRSRFEGMAVATNAQITSPVVQYVAAPNKYWLFQVANPHLTETGAPATGTFTAYVPPNYFWASDIDPTATEFSIAREDGSTVTPVSGTVTPGAWGGTVLRLDNVGYSNPKFKVTSVAKAKPVMIGKPTVTVTSSSIKISTKVTVNGKGRVSLAGLSPKGAASSTTRCTAASKSFTKAGYATITCTIGSTGRTALRKGPMFVAMRASFTPTGKSATSAVRALLIPKKA